MFKYRVITAVILIPIVLLAMWKLPPLIFSVLMGGVIAIAAWEWARLTGFVSFGFRAGYVLLILLGLILIHFISALPILIIGLMIQTWALFEILSYQARGQAILLRSHFWAGLFGFLLLLAFWKGAVVLKGANEQDALRLIYLIFIIWIADSGAYFIGKRWGKHKLASRVSPNKTWEGVWGGILSAFLAVLVLSFVLFHASGAKMLFIWALSLLAVLFSVIGDLTVSLLKRLTGIKDSGHIFPGHGGMLDRIDSLIAATLVFALGILI